MKLRELVAHSNVLAWRIPGTGEPGGLPSLGRTESFTTEAMQQQQQQQQQQQGVGDGIIVKLLFTWALNDTVTFSERNRNKSQFYSK